MGTVRASKRHRSGAWLLGGLLLLASAGSAQARTETLRWQHPNAAAISSFKVYVGSASGGSDVLVQNLGKPTPDGSGIFSATITVPDSASVYVTMTAIDANSVESLRSNEIVRWGPLGPPGQPQPQ